MRHNYENEKEIMIQSLKSFPWSDKACYGDYLAQTYYYVNHSERLLALAAALMCEEDRKMQRRFFSHLSEENSHDLMVKKDLENLGYSLEDFPERPETKIFWETQYYKIEHQDPSALMGYILLLEDVASSICTWIHHEVEKYHGKKCSTFLRVHGEEDPDHVDEALKVIEALGINRKERIYANLKQSQIAYKNMISAIVEENLSSQEIAA
jgi:thiaminase